MPQLTAPEQNKAFNKNRTYSSSAKSSPLQYVLLATLLVLLSVAAIKFFFQNKEQPERIRVVAAAQDIPAGCKIDFGSLHYLTIPRQYATTGMYSSYEQVLGKTTNLYIRKGNPISKQELLPEQSLARSLAKNQRAITLRLEPEMQVDHCLQTGDKVDVLVTVQAQAKGKTSKKYTKTVCQNLTVLVCTPREASLSRNAKTSDSNRVTLAATPAECEQLSQASETGKMRLVLRNYMYQSDVMLSGADERDLLPAYVQKEMAEAELAARKDSAAAPAPMFAPVPAPPPIASVQSNPDPMRVIQETVAQPIQWVVEMFSGSKKENYVIPAR